MTRVIDASGAARGGLEAGDVIRALDGEEIESFPHLRRLLFDHAVGDTVRLRVARGDGEIDLEVTLGERPKL